MVMEVTNSFLLVQMPVLQEEFHDRYCKSGQKFMTGCVIGPREESILVMLNSCPVRLSRKYLPLYI